MKLYIGFINPKNNMWSCFKTEFDFDNVEYSEPELISTNFHRYDMAHFILADFATKEQLERHADDFRRYLFVTGIFQTGFSITSTQVETWLSRQSASDDIPF